MLHAQWSYNSTTGVVSHNGFVGIGTTTPAVKLSISGDANTEIIHNISSVDPVKIMYHINDSAAFPSAVVSGNSLGYYPRSEVGQYIKQHHHLPEVPFTDEVENNGNDLEDNQATLLKKIEELTLYIIEQNKRIEALESKLETINKELNK